MEGCAQNYSCDIFRFLLVERFCKCVISVKEHFWHRGGLEHFGGNTDQWALSVKNMSDDAFSTTSFYQT